MVSTDDSPKYRSNIPSLVAAFSAALTTGGTTYAFGLYGTALKNDLKLSASQLDTISTAFFFAGLFSWIPGLCADRYGTRFSIALGGITGATSLLSFWIVARQFVVISRALLVPTLSIFGVGIFLSCALVTGSVFKIIVSSCGAGTKGSAVGVAKGYVGLGSGAYSVLFASIRGATESALDFLPMAAFFFLVCATIPALILIPTQKQSQTEVIQDHATPTHFRILFGSLVVMAVLVVGDSLLELLDSKKPDDISDAVVDVNAHSHRHWGTVVLLVGAWLGPVYSLLFLPPTARQSDDHAENEGQCRDETNENTSNVAQSPGTPTTERRGLEDLSARGGGSSRGEISMHKLTLPVDDNDLEDATDDAEGERLLGNEGEPQALTTPAPVGQDEDGENLNLVQMLQTPSAMFLLWTTTILVGAGTVETNNMGEMVQSLGFADAVTPASLALFSVAQAAGRVATGAISEAALGWNTKRFCIDSGVPRPFFLVIASLVGFFAHFVLGLAQSEFFFVVGSALSGVAFGMVWPLMVLVVGEVFGTVNAGANYLFFDGFSSAAGTLLLTKMLAQHVYERHIDEGGETPNTCLGAGCFRTTHMVAAFLSLSCALTSGAMVYTSRHIYNKSASHRS